MSDFKYTETLDPETGSVHITNSDGCDWCDGVGTSPNGTFCGECNCVNKETCAERNKSTRVVFLDYDGVVNTPIWEQTNSGMRCRFGFPSDNKVNNFQAVQWLSELCEKEGYDIVVTSTWRLDKNYKECLINGGLRPGIKVLGRTKELRGLEDYWHDRGYEIKDYLKEHPEITSYIIIDDENCFLDDQQEFFVHTREDVGFMETEYMKAKEIARKNKIYESVFGGRD